VTGAPIAAFAIALGAGLAWVVAGIPPVEPALPALVASSLGSSGVEHPVTAVLLAFRSYDTLLEVAVLLAAVLPVLATSEPAPGRSAAPEEPREPVLSPFTRLLVPFAVIVAGYLLWVGSYAPGGAFQAGAVLAAAAVLLQLARRVPRVGVHAPWLRTALVVGLAAFLGVAVATAAAGAGFLALPPGHAGVLILAIEVALTVSIAASLSSMFPGAIGQDSAEGGDSADGGDSAR
jgi:multisubunit Na+/H+ antiporter MnhB subunit